MTAALACVAAVLLDRWLGEPRRWHPLTAFGRLAHAAELRLHGPLETFPTRRRLRGALALTLLIGPFVLSAWLLGRSGPAAFFFDTLLLYVALGAASLEEHARAVALPLAAGDLEEAQARVGWMVSRDTGAMDGEAVARAAVESVLENGNDAIFAALFWFLLLGAPGAVLYRLANTLDAMWGYRTPRHLHFGWAAARLDDLLNWIPARLVALTYGLLGDLPRALRCWRRQARAWESPNAGPVMAAGAGALGLRLGGPAWYHGALVARPELGEGTAPKAGDIERALGLVRGGLWLWLALIVVGGLAYG